jgi:CubicO group peptidase (beta-lactamase class C family)
MTISLVALALASPAAAQHVAPVPPTPYARAIAAGYKAALYCSGMFNAGRNPVQIDKDELHGIYPEYDAIVPTLPAMVDAKTATVTVAFDDKLPPRRATWSKPAGCTSAPIGAPPPPIVTSYATPPTPLAADPRPWPMGDAGIAPKPRRALAATIAKAFDHASYGAGETISVLVVDNGKIIAERYRHGWGPFASNRTWSVGKSISGTLIGIATGAPNTTGGATLSPSSAVIPQWKPGDPRHAITLDHLLRMASGLHSDTAGNRTDAIYFGGTAVDEQAPTWPLEAKPGARFRYANNDILLAVYGMRLAIGDEQYKGYPAHLFEALGMKHTVAETDWRGNFILSSQVWSTARDFARLGQFWLQDGVWQGKRILPEGWMTYMTTPSGPQPESGPGYGATMWLFGPRQGLPEGSYAAQGNRGQYVMVIPSRKLVIVRRGEDPGAARFDIAKFAADVAAAIQ